MLELDLPSPATTAAGALQVLLFFVVGITYILFKIVWSIVDGVVEHEPENGPSETSKLRASTDGGQGQSVRPTVTPLVIWAALILPINSAAWYVPNVAWLRALDDQPAMWKAMILFMISLCPVMASGHVFLHVRFLARKGALVPGDTEMARVLLRAWLLDGVLLAPASAAYAAYLFPERMLGRCCPLVWAAAYASQALVWAYFYRVSWRESQACLRV